MMKQLLLLHHFVVSLCLQWNLVLMMRDLLPSGCFGSGFGSGPDLGSGSDSDSDFCLGLGHHDPFWGLFHSHGLSLEPEQASDCRHQAWSCSIAAESRKDC